MEHFEIIDACIPFSINMVFAYSLNMILTYVNFIINKHSVRYGHSINYFLNTIKKVMTFP